ncbi:lipid-binding SYLF domain-containing protein [Frateuria aurantia]
MKKNRRLSRLVLLVVAVFSVSMPVWADDGPTDQARESLRVLREIMDTPDKSIPVDLLRDARAVAVIPDVLKVGFIFGGRRGEGLISVKQPDGSWSYPSYVVIAGGSFGLQVGVSKTDLVLVFRTQRGVDSLVSGKFTIGADASAAAGPVGRTAGAATDGALNAEIYTYSRARGLFAGIALDGAVLKPDYDANAAIYGPGVTPRRIFEGGVGPVPAPVGEFRERLKSYTQP